MYLFYNQKYHLANTPIIPASSKALRYGELVFETIKYSHNKLFFVEHHYNRLIQAANLLQLNIPIHFTQKILEQNINNLLAKNKLSTARVRVTLHKGEGGLFENDEKATNLLIETYNLPTPNYEWNSNGLDICLYSAIKKTIDTYSNYKTGNYLVYNMAALYAKQQKCNEAILLNTNNKVCDGTISTIFLVKNNTLITPPLSDGGVAGIMRQHIINHTQTIQQSITINDVITADEVVLTNVIKGLQWVKQFEDKKYENNYLLQLYNQIIVPLNQPFN